MTADTADHMRLSPAFTPLWVSDTELRFYSLLHAIQIDIGEGHRSMYEALLASLQVPCTIDELAECLPAWQRDALIDNISLLHTHGIIETGDDQDGSPLFQFIRQWSETGNGPQAHRASATTSSAHLRDAAIAIVGSGVLAHALESHLTQLSVTSITQYPKVSDLAGFMHDHNAVDLVVYADLPNDDDAILALNSLMLDYRQQWTSLRWDGRSLHLGPSIIPGETSCYQCYLDRLEANLTDLFAQHLIRDNWQLIARTLGHPGNWPGVGLFAFEITKLISPFMPPMSIGHVLSVDLFQMSLVRHRVLRLPRCKSCTRSHPESRFDPWQRLELD